jgi:hypothetical protein
MKMEALKYQLQGAKNQAALSEMQAKKEIEYNTKNIPISKVYQNYEKGGFYKQGIDDFLTSWGIKLDNGMVSAADIEKVKKDRKGESGPQTPSRGHRRDPHLGQGIAGGSDRRRPACEHGRDDRDPAGFRRERGAGRADRFGADRGVRPD